MDLSEYLWCWSIGEAPFQLEPPSTSIQYWKLQELVNLIALLQDDLWNKWNPLVQVDYSVGDHTQAPGIFCQLLLSQWSQGLAQCYCDPSLR